MILFFKLLPKPFGVKLSSAIVNRGLFYRVNTFGKEDSKAQMFIVNHQSGIDIPIVEGATKADLAWVAKQELFDLPFLGLGVKLPNDIPLQRENKTALVSLIRECKDRIKHGRTVTIFPEGTRSRNHRMQKFKPGAQTVANKLQLKVQPIVVVGTSSAFDSKEKRFYPFKKIDLIFLDAFVADKGDKEWLHNTQITMQKVYDEHANALRHR
ncbi:MAG: 1-acyl-sn-glycerol-3-phosphate acyltransferase [Campylobacterales bacterium]|nr:1-acyl-sn-glycerol-3-phosphate acyltransferase [Campylobacterales bacterium]